jgi:hypothetical protein
MRQMFAARAFMLARGGGERRYTWPVRGEFILLSSRDLSADIRKCNLQLLLESSVSRVWLFPVF